jgi:hypothetical protein
LGAGLSAYFIFSLFLDRTDDPMAHRQYLLKPCPCLDCNPHKRDCRALR